MITANLHSIESMGLVDGPGIRTVFFLKGCPLKCKYCHNPDTQNYMGGTTITVDDVVEKAKRFIPYYRVTGGGVTFSGGEPLMQGAFLSQALKRLKEEGISTCIDTSGFGVQKYYSEILAYTDVVLLDIKHVDTSGHQWLIGVSPDGAQAFKDALANEFQGNVIIRHVMVPGQTDSQSAMVKLVDQISRLAKKVEKIEILPYHKKGVDKYVELGEEDPLASIPEMNQSIAEELEIYANQLLVERRQSRVAI